MTARILMIAALSLMGATNAQAEPQRALREPEPNPSPRVVLASAEQVQPSSADQPAPTKRPRIARVTTCRCGETPAQNQQQQ